MEGSRYHASRRRTHNRALGNLLQDPNASAERVAILAQHILKAPGNSSHRRYGVDTRALGNFMEQRQSQAYLDTLIGEQAIHQVVSPPQIENSRLSSDIIAP